MRSVRFGNLLIHAVDYNPVSNTIKVVKNINFSIHFDNANHELTNELKTTYYSPYFEPIFNQLINYSPLSSRNDNMIGDPATYVIIANTIFDGYLDEFVEWKTQKGYIVEIVYTNDIGTSASSIRAYLMELYNNPSIQLPAPSFVLLVGDTNQIPASYSSGGHVSDLDYCDFTGDGVPDMLPSYASGVTADGDTIQISFDPNEGISNNWSDDLLFALGMNLLKLEISGSGKDTQVQSAGIVRTARKIMDGELFVPANLWPSSS